MSTTLSQKEAVFQAVTKVLSEVNVSFDIGNTDVKGLMTKEFRAQVNQILFESFRNGTVALDGEKTDNELRQYVSGLQTNWLGKDKRLNGNVQYAAKNPGSRTGSTDAQIKALRGLLSQTEDEAERQEIQGYINDRLEQLEGEKRTKKVASIDMSVLPAELQAKYSSDSAE